ncbi:MAG: metallophosphoesterase, partial [Actinomycetota bacterium]|nr:metallophosphoesterase [Actinomycetota bacterium]
MIALLYDVHGNAPALDAVIADARDAGATEWLIGGDVALFGAFPAETVARLRSLEGARWLRGNGER